MQDVRNKKPGFTCTLCGDCLATCRDNSVKYRCFELKPDTARKLYIFRPFPCMLFFSHWQGYKMKFFSLGPDRIFTRNRAILGHDVRMCHPPSSVHVVEQILSDFRSEKKNSAAFWINMQGRFIYIEYFAVRGKEGEYLGTIEFTQDLTHLRKLEGEQRLLSYAKK